MQEYFVYFKIFKPISWDERPAERRCRFIQRFLNKSERQGGRIPATISVDRECARFACLYL